MGTQSLGEPCSEKEITLDSQWNAGTTGTFHLLFLESVTHWHVKLALSSPIYEFDVWDWDGDIDVGFVLDVPFRFRYVNNGVMSEVNGIELNGASLCGDNRQFGIVRSTI